MEEGIIYQMYQALDPTNKKNSLLNKFFHIFIQSSPRYTLAAKREDNLSKNNVGPGQYEPKNEQSKLKSPSYS